MLGCSHGSWPYRSRARISACERWQLPFRAGHQEAVACRGLFDHPNNWEVPLQAVERPSSGAWECRLAHGSRLQRALRPRSVAGVSIWFARAPVGIDARPRNRSSFRLATNEYCSSREIGVSWELHIAIGEAIGEGTAPAGFGVRHAGEASTPTGTF